MLWRKKYRNILSKSNESSFHEQSFLHVSSELGFFLSIITISIWWASDDDDDQMMSTVLQTKLYAFWNQVTETWK